MNIGLKTRKTRPEETETVTPEPKHRRPSSSKVLGALKKTGNKIAKLSVAAKNKVVSLARKARRAAPWMTEKTIHGVGWIGFGIFITLGSVITMVAWLVEVTVRYTVGSFGRLLSKVAGRCAKATDFKFGRKDEQPTPTPDEVRAIFETENVEPQVSTSVDTDEMLARYQNLEKNLEAEFNHANDHKTVAEASVVFGKLGAYYSIAASLRDNVLLNQMIAHREITQQAKDFGYDPQEALRGFEEMIRLWAVIEQAGIDDQVFVA